MVTSDDFTIDYGQEPRKVFINFLIWNIKVIETLVYGGRTSQALTPLVGLIHSLDNKSQKALTDQYEKLQEMRSNMGWRRDELEQVYREVLGYLHQTYLQEVSRVKALNPKPKHIRDEQ